MAPHRKLGGHTQHAIRSVNQQNFIGRATGLFIDKTMINEALGPPFPFLVTRSENIK
jgi:hypothetical protein